MSNNEIDIYGFIDSMTVEGMTISPQTVKDQLKEMSDEKEIIVNINSQGGDVFSGVAIYNMLRRQDAHITVNIDGLAASIASVIAMAGDTVNMPNNAVLMIHNAWTNVTGDSNEFKKQADSLERINSVVFNSYIDKNPDIDHALLRQYMDEETWFTAKEAEELGLIDNITESTRVAAAATSTMLGGETFMSKYHNEGNEQTETPTADDVMAILKEIKSDVKAVREEVEGKDDSKKEGDSQSQPPQNSFARLFNMQTK
ncbi:head maturation protease, ClpP-related [Staphylococcus ureilyticus]|uniref:head maturation protease, ClpP-related n=1 Tax=Staphylococcus ureilyticus TaxID=94138 RepID=UPI0011A6A394|nr:head maturation protease, ClpP-related [Staphylococcus ureilyticus]